MNAPIGTGTDMVGESETSRRTKSARALWCEAPNTYGFREHDIAPRGAELVIETVCSGVSRGTERLVLSGAVPESEAARMRCPHQEGDFPFPVKYGYASVGRVAAGPRTGELVFALHPHQSVFTFPDESAIAVPEGVTPARASLAANMETALNVVWDSGASSGDRVLVIGGGVVGLLIARLLSRIPGIVVTVCDQDEGKRDVVVALGAAFCGPSEAPTGVDVAINVSAAPAGLRVALSAAGLEACVVEASWYGAKTAELPLGEAFHSQRLRLVSSQVGRIPSNRLPRWSHRRRLETALALTADDALDILLTHTVALSDAPRELPRLLEGRGPLHIVLDHTA